MTARDIDRLRTSLRRHVVERGNTWTQWEHGPRSRRRGPIMSDDHIRHWSRTLDYCKLGGGGHGSIAEIEAKMGNRCISWCGSNASGTWFFQGVEHTLMAMDTGGAIPPCKDCLAAMRKVIEVYL